MNSQKIIKALIFIGLWSVLLIPFWVANTMFFPYITGKNFAFRIIIEIIFALWVYLAYVNEIYRPRFSWILGSVTLFVIIMAFADFFAVAPLKAFFSNFERMDGWITLIHMLMYLLVFASVMKGERVWLWFFRTSIVLSAIMMIPVFREWLTTGEQRVSVTLGNPIYVAIYFLFNFFFALILLNKDVLSKKSESLKKIFTDWLTYIYSIAAVLFVFGIWRTGTRGVILGLIGGLVISSIVIAIFEKKNKIMRKFSVILLVIIAVVVIGFIGIRNTQFVKNSSTLQRLAEISWNDVQGQGQARQYVWPMAVKGVFEHSTSSSLFPYPHLLLGWGQDGFNYLFNKYYDVRMYNQEQWFDRAHDMPLDMLVAGGILGLLSYLLIFVAALYIIWKRRNHLGVTDAALLIGLLAAYFFQNLFVFDNLTSYMFFYATLAYVFAKDMEAMHVSFVKGKKMPNQDIANYVIAPILIIIFGASIYFFNIRPMSANLTLIDAMQSYPEGPTKNLQLFQQAISYNSFGNPEIREQLASLAPQVAQMSVDTQIKQQFISFTYDQMLLQVASTPNDARYQLFMGIFLDNIGQYAQALPYLQKAVELSPMKLTMMFELSKCYLYLGQYDKALAIAKAAYDLVPEYDDARNAYISAAIVTGDNTLVKQLMGSATTTTSDVIVRAYLIRASDFLKKGDKADAILEVQKAIAIAPGFKTQGLQIIEGIQKGTVK